MVFKKVVVPIAVFVIFVSAGFGAYQIADAGQDQAAQQPRTVENETLIQQVGNWQLVSKSLDQFTAGFNDSVTVYNESGVELTEGTDYEWNSTDGAIKYLDTPRTQDGNTSNVTYVYQENTEAVKKLTGPLDVVTVGVGKAAYLAGGFGLILVLMAIGVVVAQWLSDTGPRTNR